MIPSFLEGFCRLLLCFLYFQHGVLGELLGLLLGKRGVCLFSSCHSKISGARQLDVVL